MAKICNLANNELEKIYKDFYKNKEKIKQIYGGFNNGIKNNTKRNGNY